jgi:hypothetical protein
MNLRLKILMAVKMTIENVCCDAVLTSFIGGKHCFGPCQDSGR